MYIDVDIRKTFRTDDEMCLIELYLTDHKLHECAYLVYRQVIERDFPGITENDVKIRMARPHNEEDESPYYIMSFKPTGKVPDSYIPFSEFKKTMQ